jgi:hypothetical protein
MFSAILIQKYKYLKMDFPTLRRVRTISVLQNGSREISDPLTAEEKGTSNGTWASKKTIEVCIADIAAGRTLCQLRYLHVSIS